MLVIVPAHNEGENLRSVLSNLGTCRPDVDVVVIDDGSTDETASVARKAGAAVVSHRINQGYSAAVRSGFQYAISRGYAVACMFDADGQHLAEELALILEPVLADRADLVLGSRFRGRGGYEGPLLRTLGTRLFSVLASRITGAPLTDITSGFRAVNVRALRVLGERYPGEPSEVASVILASQAGLRIHEVAVRMRARISGISTYDTWRSVAWPPRTLCSVILTLLRGPGPVRARDEG